MKHSKQLTVFLLLVVFTMNSATLSSQSHYCPTPENIASRSEFQDNKFGIFIHWGVYAMLGQGEWVMTNQNINYQEYAKLPSAFYPIQFDAQKWVSAIKASGAKYICITSRHHDGFSMFGTKQSPYNIVDATPFGRDPLKELAIECEKQGIKLHFYYSLLDWYRDDYQPVGRTGNGTGRPGKGEWKDYYAFMKGQITELLTNYGEIGCIWFDGHWDQDQNSDFDWGYEEIYSLIHNLQPKCLIGNNHHIDIIEGEDIQIFERDVPGQNTAGWHSGGVSALPLETCQTMNDSWGYRVNDDRYKSIPKLIKYLASTAGRNANLLLNIGPQPNGELPEAAIERLKGMGEWLSQYGSSIYGTRSSLIPPQSWGVATEKDKTLYLHIFPDDLASAQIKDMICVPLKNAAKIKSVTTFGTQEKLTFKQYKEGIFVTLPQIPKECPDYVVEVKW